MRKADREALRKRVVDAKGWLYTLDRIVELMVREVDRAVRRERARYREPVPKLLNCVLCGKQPVPEWKLWRWRIACPGPCGQKVASACCRLDAAVAWNEMNVKGRTR